MPEGETHLPSELLLVGAVFFAPFAFGTTESWSRAVLAGMFALMVFLRYRAFGWSGLAPVRVPPALWGLGLLLGIALLQAANPVSPLKWADARGLFTFSRPRTLDWLFDWGLYAGMLLVLPNLFRNPQAVLRFAWALLICGALLSMVGVAQLQAGNTHYFGVRQVSDFRVPFGPFPNKNHAGTFLSLCALAGAGLAAAHLEQFRKLRPEGREDEFYGRLAVILALEFLVIAGLLQARSLGAVVAAAVAGAGALALCFLGARGQRGLAAFWLLAIMFGVILGALSTSKIRWAGYLPGAGERSVSFRLSMAEDGLRMVAAHPLLGSGLGALRAVYPAWISPSMKGFFTDHLHCDPIELAAEAGVPSAALFYSLLGLTLWQALRSAASDRRLLSPLLFFLGAAFLSFLIHQSVEFPSHIVSVHALALACLCACWGQANAAEPPPAQDRPSPRRVAFAAAALAAFFVVALVPRLAAAYCDLLASSYPQPSRHYFQVRALNWEPTFERECRLASSSLQMAYDNPAARTPLLRMAREHASAAVALEPLHPDALVIRRRVSRAWRAAPRSP